MKNCPHCKINVIGDKQVCPLCQNDLRGDGTDEKWPDSVKLKKQSLLYRIQLFFVLAATMVCLALDFLFDLWNGSIHWSFVVLLWVLGVQLSVVYIYKTYTVLARMITLTVVNCVVLLLITAFYLNFMTTCISLIIPIIYSACLVVDFLLCLVDRSGNTLVYFLFMFVLSGISYAILFTKVGKSYLIWNICLLLCGIGIMGILVFQGKKVLIEIQKRLSV